ncbi:MAG TPA: DNA methyltransferase, partial [Ktedonobacterales bacterium]|nr:DNA methyltransferase [Ktedonobacterales bacterium]
LKLLHDLEFEVITWQVQHGGQLTILYVNPDQLFGMDINPYAAELAQAVIWIGHLQWMLDHGRPADDPVLKKLSNIACRDSLLDLSDPQRPRETEWPAATCIVSNPPFLGVRRLRDEMGNEAVDALWRVYDGKVSRESDLVCYFVERARDQLEQQRVQRVGMITTNSIRGGANRKVLDRIKTTIIADEEAHHADIFVAWADRPWILDGAAVRISIVGFDGGEELSRTLDGKIVGAINADLTSAVDLTKAHRLAENLGIAFMGDTKGGSFDIDDTTAGAMLTAKGNPNGRPNSDVVKSWMNGLDITRRPRNMWIIDFGNSMSLEQAALYEQPFEYVKQHVQPFRAKNNRAQYRDIWWIHAESRSGMRNALMTIKRYIVTPTVAKYRIFAWADISTIPDHQLIAIARDDDFTFGVLHSHTHEIWSLRMCTWLGVVNDPRYTPTTCFETFPFPHPTDEQREAIAAGA